MKKLLILLFSILISFNSYGFFGLFDKTVCLDAVAQERNYLIHLPNETKPFTGSDLCKDEDGQILSEGKVNNGKITSLTKYEYYKNGQKKSERNYKTVGEEHYIDHETEDGKQILWYENGLKNEEVNYKDGILDGKWTSWYENGQIKAEHNYKDGILDGKWTWWYENGQKRAEGNYKDGKDDGKLTYWHENGQLDFEGYYKDGEIVH